jgi:hypothetical protein
MKFDTTYLARHELVDFKRKRQTGEISFFKSQLCNGILNMDSGPAPCDCPNEIPKIIDTDTGAPMKLYCSKKCHDAIEVITKDEDDEHEDDEW